MRLSILVVAVAGVILSACQMENHKTLKRPSPPIGSLAYLDYQDGLSGYHFNQPLSLTPWLKVSQAWPASGLVNYSPPDDSLKFAGIPVDKIEYQYYKDKLVNIDFATGNPQTREDIMAMLVRLYGAGTPDTLFEGDYSWETKNVMLSTTIHTMYDDLSHFHIHDLYFMHTMSVAENKRAAFAKEIFPQGRTYYYSDSTRTK